MLVQSDIYSKNGKLLWFVYFVGTFLCIQFPSIIKFYKIIWNYAKCFSNSNSNVFQSNFFRILYLPKTWVLLKLKGPAWLMLPPALRWIHLVVANTHTCKWSQSIKCANTRTHMDTRIYTITRNTLSLLLSYTHKTFSVSLSLSLSHTHTTSSVFLSHTRSNTHTHF